MNFRPLCLLPFLAIGLPAQDPEILFVPEVAGEHYLPDYSYAGYRHGVPESFALEGATVLDAVDFGVIPDDGRDDSDALAAVLAEAHRVEGPVRVQLPPGRLILTKVLYIGRGNIVIRGAGSGLKGTTLHCPRPMTYMEDPPALEELREYLVTLDKRQREPRNNLDLPYSQYSWSGGMIWAQVQGERAKSYLSSYYEKSTELAGVSAGVRGERTIEVDQGANLAVGDVVQLEWFNREGAGSSLIDELYQGADVKVGSHHWEYPDEPLVRQPLRIEAIDGTRVTLSAPLLLDARPEWGTVLTEWKHLENVGIEHLRFEFPEAPGIAHHVEPGYNAIYLTRVYDGWVDDVVIHNADSGVLTENSANLSIRQVTTTGSNLAHYSVQVGGVHNVLVEGLKVYNEVRHPLSFNTFATKSVYKDCEVFTAPVLDQHSGANHQNLFDRITVHVSLDGERDYPLFKGGGAGYWKPTHGAFSTFWNIRVHFLDGLENTDPVRLYGMEDGPAARLIGVSGNLPVSIDYGPDAHIGLTNSRMNAVPSLYEYQLEQRR